jgi:hypothetical protein
VRVTGYVAQYSFAILVVAHDAQELAALAALGDPEAIVALGLEDRQVPGLLALGGSRVKATALPREDEGHALGPPNPEQLCDRGRRLGFRVPGLRVGRVELERLLGELQAGRLDRDGRGGRVRHHGRADPVAAAAEQHREEAGHRAAVAEEDPVALPDELKA